MDFVFECAVITKWMYMHRHIDKSTAYVQRLERVLPRVLRHGALLLRPQPQRQRRIGTEAHAEGEEVAAHCGAGLELLRGEGGGGPQEVEGHGDEEDDCNVQPSPERAAEEAAGGAPRGGLDGGWWCGDGGWC